MVQRKVSCKLGLQAADHLKSEKRLANLKPSSHQYQEYGKTIGSEMMRKKMKRSRSIKLSDFESLRSSLPSKHTISQPGKPPPLDVITTATEPPQKQQIHVRTTTYGSPNYMKGTSSSEARKESSQVSPRRSSSCSISKHGSGSSNKPSRILAKSSSLNMVRTLTKSPSFKHVRHGSKKCSGVVLCADVKSRRATCSSTLKESKFPDNLVLNPGGNQVEGTSVMKVCPYTYCSLNGHHHKPLLPLKCFLSARRRMLKIQKSKKLEALSPGIMTPTGDEMEEFDGKQVVFYTQPTYTEGDLNNSPRSPLIKEVEKNFFIKIYAKSIEENCRSFHGNRQEAEVEHDNNERNAGNLSAGSPEYETDFDENFEQGRETLLGADIMEGFHDEEEADDPYNEYPANAAQIGVINHGNDFEVENNGSSEENGGISEASDMEWEEGQYPTTDIDTESDDSMENENESDFDDGYSSEIENHDFNSEPISKSENIVVNVGNKSQAEEIFTAESTCSETLRGDSDFEMGGSHQKSKIIKSCQVSGCDQESTTEEAETDLSGFVITSAWTEASSLEPISSVKEIEEKSIGAANEISGIGPQVEEDENYYALEGKYETLTDQQKESLQDDDFQRSDKADRVVKGKSNSRSQETEDSKGDRAEKRNQVAISGFDFEQEMLNNGARDQLKEIEHVVVTTRSIGVQVPDDLFEAYLDGGKVDDKQNLIERSQLKNSAQDIDSSQDVVGKILPDEKQKHPSIVECNYTTVIENQSILGNNEDEVKKFRTPSSMDSEEQSDSRMYKTSLAEIDHGAEEKIGAEDRSQSDTTETLAVTGCKTTPELQRTSMSSESKSNQELTSSCSNQNWTIKSKRPINDDEEIRNFNPREPNFLPVVPDPDAEKVDLKHQMLDEKKTSEEWMVDYALRQAVTKLAPARKRKVALLVEAFETVSPIPKFGTHLRHTPAAFPHARTMQACS